MIHQACGVPHAFPAQSSFRLSVPYCSAKGEISPVNSHNQGCPASTPLHIVVTLALAQRQTGLEQLYRARGITLKYRATMLSYSGAASSLLVST